VPQRDHDAADEDRALLPDQAIGDPAARNRQRVDAEGVEAVDRRGSLGVHAEAAARGVRHEQHQQGAHSVIAEALPHLGEEQGREAARVPEPLGRRGNAARGGRHESLAVRSMAREPAEGGDRAAAGQ
jgi:hypothetical protein